MKRNFRPDNFYDYFELANVNINKYMYRCGQSAPWINYETMMLGDVISDKNNVIHVHQSGMPINLITTGTVHVMYIADYR